MDLCPPAIIYLIFSLIQIIIDIFRGYFNTALIKTFVMMIITFLLNLLCNSGLSVLSWIIVFIPFIFMTLIITLLLYAFGLNATTGSFDKNTRNISIDKNNNIIIYDPYDNYEKHPAFYKNPNIIIPNPNASNSKDKKPLSNPILNHYSPNWISSDPSYQS